MCNCNSTQKIILNNFDAVDTISMANIVGHNIPSTKLDLYTITLIIKVL